MVKTLADEYNNYLLSQSPLAFFTILEANKKWNELEQKLNNQFKGVLARGIKVTWNSYNFYALRNMKRISEEDLSKEEKEAYRSYLKRTNSL